MACVCNGNAFPELFFVQSETTLALPDDTTTPILTLEPIVTMSTDEVKLDSMAELNLNFAIDTGLITLDTINTISGITYRLERSTNGGMFMTLAELEINEILTLPTLLADADVTQTIFPNLTWVDTPGVGTHIYRIVIENDFVVPTGVTLTATAETRALNALVIKNA